MWRTVALGDLCEFVRGPFGGSLKKNIFVSDGYAVYEQQHAINNQCADFRYFITEDKFKEMQRFVVKPNDILMSCSGTIGKTTIVPSDAPLGIINQALLKITASEEVDTLFLKLFMQSSHFSAQLMNTVDGAAIQNVASVKILKQILISLPPLAEQKRIVAKLDAAFAEIDRAVELTVKRHINTSSLIAKAQNSLFEGMPLSVPRLNLSEVAKFENGDRGKNYPSKKYQISEGIPFVNAGDFSLDGDITSNSMAYISEERFNLLGAGKFKKDDVLFCLRGSLGKSAINKTLEQGAIASSLVIIRALQEHVHADYLFAFMRSDLVKTYISETAGGAAQPNLSAKVVMGYELPVPPLVEQEVIADKFWALRQQGLDAISLIKKKKLELTALKSAILAQELQPPQSEAA